MQGRTPIAALIVLATVMSLCAGAEARQAEPMLPTALVEDVKSASAGLEFMDYVGVGQVIKLAAGDVLVLSYLRSCEHEIITGGTVRIGMERSDIADGKVERGHVPCEAGKIALNAEQANQSGASAFRVQSAEITPVVYDRSPVVQLPKDLEPSAKTLVIERRGGKNRHEIALDGSSFHDLAKDKIRLKRGAVYVASVGSHTMTFKVDATAKTEAPSVLTRLLRFQ